MTPVEICTAVLGGIVPAASLPELSDDDVQQEVRYRLSQVGCDLVYSRNFRSWTARFTRGTPDIDAMDAPNSLNSADLAVLAVCWLHLRFLPAENSRISADDEEALFAAERGPHEVPLDESEIAAQIPALPRNSIKISLGKLKNTRFLSQREGRLFAGPLMDAIDEVRAAEQARRLMLRHLRMQRTSRQQPENGSDHDNHKLPPDQEEEVADAPD